MKINYGSSDFTLKQKDTLVNQVLIPLIQSEIKKIGITKQFYGTVKQVNGDNTADIDITFGDNTTTMDKLHNKSGVILNVGDLVVLTAPMGELNNMYIDKRCKKDFEINALNLSGDLRLNGIRTDEDGLHFNNKNVDEINSLQCDNVQIKDNGNIYYANAMTKETLSDCGNAKIENGQCIIEINSALQENIYVNNYIFKFYPYESCNYTITRNTSNIVISADKDIEFGWEIMGVRK
ncbi:MULTISPECIES: hypothetical protein [Clostridium]|uniref:hypothetical protein n=1 Tax=Clostridium TaxID=1485 RepID=UPI000825841D|nr:MULTISPECIES: hypothetical protein [Clostridium]PJI07659.1 hypothetical protein CUB90_07185 [Clostridium sp. CT7]